MKSPQNRREFLKVAGTSLTAGLFATTLRAEAGRKPLRLVFFTDVHAREGEDIAEALDLAAETIRRLKPDLVIGGGDFIHGGLGLRPAEAEPRFAIARRFLDGLGCRTELTLGNHDLIRFPPENLDPARAWDPRGPAYGAYGLSSTCRSVTLNGLRFFFLDPVEVLADGYRGFVPPDQMEWLRSELANTPPSMMLALVSHIPFRTAFRQIDASPLSPLTPNLVVENANEVLELFEGRDLRLVLQGHLHYDEAIRVNRTTFLMGGAICGHWWGGAHLGTPEGFAEIVCTDGGPESRYRTYGWSANA